MSNFYFLAILLLLYSVIYISNSQTYKWPSVAITVLVRNKAHTLPYFLTCIHQLEYPKDRIYIWFHTENNEDNTLSVLDAWKEENRHKYNHVYVNINISESTEIPASRWDELRFRHIIQLREKAMQHARNYWADFIFMIDADVFLTDKLTLMNLVAKNMTVVAPMLNSDGLYSNFWCGMTENYYYKRTDDYMPILNHKKEGCFEVPMVHTAVLVNLREEISDRLTYDPINVQNYDGPLDDIITFAISAKKNAIKLNICNDADYGFVTVPSEEESNAVLAEQETQQLTNLKLEALAQGVPLPLGELMEQFIKYPEPSLLGFDRIFMINLERRVERRNLMMLAFKELGMEVTVVKAVDGRELNPIELTRRSIKLMPDYEDPYHKRPIKLGEIGCFLSHFNVWKEISDKGLAVSLVLEDDVRFEPYFRRKLAQLLAELSYLDWDLMYVGRKILLDDEQAVSEHIVRPGYSYWTLGYALTLRGARKLLAARPLENLLPVDEFLPIMFDQHPNSTWKGHFEPRNLEALSASPLLITPTHYTGEPGYVSDTELSDIILVPDSGHTHIDL